jgi:hypothetical protein
MKKNYITPTMQSMELQHVQLLTGSGVTSSNGFDIPFGGIDSDGTLPPGSRELENVLGLPGFVFE